MEYNVPFITTASAATAALSGIRLLSEKREVDVLSIQEWYGQSN